MRVVIAGAGEVGYHVAGALYREGVEIAAIDNDAGVLERLRQDFNITTFLGTATDTETLAHAEVGRADLFLAITNYDETNIIACLMAAEAGAAKRIARVKSIVFGEGSSVSDRTYLGIDLIINPYEVAAEHLANLVTHPQVTDFNQFLDDRVLLVRFPIREDSRLAGATVLEFGQDSRIPNTLIALIQQNGQPIIPHAEHRIHAGDRVYFFCEPDRLNALSRYLRLSTAACRRVFVNGGGNIGLAVARRLENRTPHVRLMEISEEKCQTLSQLLNRTLVLNVDGTDSLSLKAEGIEHADSFISVTNRDQVNIVSCLLAREYGTPHTIALVKQPEYIPILESRKAVSVGFSPRLLTARKLLRFVRGETVQSFFAFPNSDIELLEMEVTAGARCEERPLVSMELPVGVLIGAVMRGREIFIPRGQDVLRAGDRVLLIQQRRHRKVTHELFFGASPHGTGGVAAASPAREASQ
ncbi:MAG: Trk system potassium transporter TrkA [bacterium]